LIGMIVTALVVIGLFVVMGFFFPVMFIAALAAAFLLALSFAAGIRRTKAETEKADPGVDTLQ
jgi:membrane protein implicated in regulation of membrane protease activity